jgi:hypothetical protein
MQTASNFQIYNLALFKILLGPLLRRLQIKHEILVYYVDVKDIILVFNDSYTK